MSCRQLLKVGALESERRNISEQTKNTFGKLSILDLCCTYGECYCQLQRVQHFFLKAKDRSFKRIVDVFYDRKDYMKWGGMARNREEKIKHHQAQYFRGLIVQ